MVLKFEKIEISCPFCLESTGKWKTWEVIPIVSKVIVYSQGIAVGIKKKNELEIKQESQAKEWERNILQLHLETCVMRERISKAVLEIYKLAGVA